MNTKYFKIQMDAPLEDQLAEAAEMLRTGGLVAFPTETVYGLGGNALDADAARKIYAAKGRPSDNPLIVHIADPADAEKYAETSELYYKIAEAFMPGPITVVLNKKAIIPLSVTGGLETVGIRCPGNAAARALIRKAGVPVAAPSANISGRPSPTSAMHVYDDMNGRIDGIVDGGDAAVGLESTIVKIHGESLTVLRPGAITPEMLLSVCDDVKLDEGILDTLPEGVRPEAPGMKYRHYAPRAKGYLIKSDCREGFDSRALAFLQARLRENPKVGVLCFDEYLPHLVGTNVVSFGSKEEDAEHSRRLFDCLRHFDKTDAPEIYAMAGHETGIGLALYNRMLKAAAYAVICL